MRFLLTRIYPGRSCSCQLHRCSRCSRIWHAVLLKWNFFLSVQRSKFPSTHRLNSDVNISTAVGSSPFNKWDFIHKLSIFYFLSYHRQYCYYKLQTGHKHKYFQHFANELSLKQRKLKQTLKFLSYFVCFHNERLTDTNLKIFQPTRFIMIQANKYLKQRKTLRVVSIEKLFYGISH